MRDMGHGAPTKPPSPSDDVERVQESPLEARALVSDPRARRLRKLHLTVPKHLTTTPRQRDVTIVLAGDHDAEIADV